MYVYPYFNSEDCSDVSTVLKSPHFGWSFPSMPRCWGFVAKFFHHELL